MSMTRLLLAPLRRRAFSQRAVRRHDDLLRSSSVSSQSSTTGASQTNSRTPPHVQHALDGRSYLLPTMTLQRVPGSSAIAVTTPAEGPLLQTRARKTPIVLDLQLVSSDGYWGLGTGSPHAQPIKKHELRAEIDRLNELGFVPVGITNASEDIKQLAQKLQLPYFISTRMHFASSQSQPQPELLAPLEHPASPSASAEPAPAPVTATEPAPTATTEASVDTTEAPAAATPPPMVIYASVRSGQQVFAQNRPLVVLGNVNSGAEVMADGDIYVMGALKGRALAGIGGDVAARITCQSFDAELVSIAHHFTTCDDLAALPQNGDLKPLKPTTVCVQDDQLHFQSTAK